MLEIISNKILGALTDMETSVVKDYVYTEDMQHIHFEINLEKTNPDPKIIAQSFIEQLIKQNPRQIVFYELPTCEPYKTSIFTNKKISIREYKGNWIKKIWHDEDVNIKLDAAPVVVIDILFKTFSQPTGEQQNG